MGVTTVGETRRWQAAEQAGDRVDGDQHADVGERVAQAADERRGKGADHPVGDVEEEESCADAGDVARRNPAHLAFELTRLCLGREEVRRVYEYLIAGQCFNRRVIK